MQVTIKGTARVTIRMLYESLHTERAGHREAPAFVSGPHFVSRSSNPLDP